MTWVAIAIGGAIGSMARHAVNLVLQGRTGTFPAGTLVVNVVGCFVIGLLAGFIAADRLILRAHWREFVLVGLLGGFTTFSTFGLDTFVLLRAQPGYAALNVATQVIGGLAAVWLGFLTGLAKA